MTRWTVLVDIETDRPDLARQQLAAAATAHGHTVRTRTIRTDQLALITRQHPAVTQPNPPSHKPS